MANRIIPTDRSRRKLQFEINDLSGGFVSQAATRNISERFLEDIQNMELVQGMWQKRKGYHQSGTFTEIDPVPGRIRGAHVFSDQGNMHVLVVANEDLYVTDRLTGINDSKVFGNSVPFSKYVSFTDFRNACYIAHGEGRILRFNGHNIKSIPSPHGDLIATYDNRIILSGIKGDPMIIYYSDRGDGNAWNALSYIVLDGKSSEEIMALVPMIGKLFILTNQNIYSLVGTMDSFSVSLEVSGIGAVSKSAVFASHNFIYFIGPNKKIYEFDGGNAPKEISYPIQYYLDSSFKPSDLENAVITTYKDAVWLTLENSPQPEEKITLVYYPGYQAWTKFKGIPAAAYLHLNDTMYFIGSHNIGSIYQFGTNFNDDFRAIDAYVKTTHWVFDALENLKRFKVMYLRGAIQSGGGNGFDIEFWVDHSKVASLRATSDIASETEIWGNNTWGELYWGSKAASSGSLWGQFNWEETDWSGSISTFSPRWGTSTWNAFVWGKGKEGSLEEDVGTIYRKVFLSQYNIISGKSLQLVFRNATPHHGFRLENLILEYIQKGAR